MRKSAVPRVPSTTTSRGISGTIRGKDRRATLVYEKRAVTNRQRQHLILNAPTHLAAKHRGHRIGQLNDSRTSHRGLYRRTDREPRTTHTDLCAPVVAAIGTGQLPVITETQHNLARATRSLTAHTATYITVQRPLHTGQFGRHTTRHGRHRPRLSARINWAARIDIPYSSTVTWQARRSLDDRRYSDNLTTSSATTWIGLVASMTMDPLRFASSATC